jgi:MFS family permease
MGARDSDPYDSALPWPDPAPTSTVRGAVRRTFKSLDSHNYRLFFFGDLISYIGSWMQTMAEAWVVWKITGSGTAVGATFAFRFLPVLLFGLWGGVIADRFDRRKVLLVTQTLSALLAVVLWLVAFTGVVNVWMVFALAAALGLVTVVDEPAKQAFVEEMVGRERVPNAVALSSAVRNSARITGPALASLVLWLLGTSIRHESWVFFINAVSFVPLVAALMAMRVGELNRFHEPTSRPQVREGLRYAWSLVDIRSTILLVAVVGTLVYNFPTFLTLMASEGFHGGAGLAGFLMAILGVGTVIGGLAAATWGRATARIVIGAAAALGVALIVAAALSSQVAFVVALVPVGAMAVFFGTVANSHMQVSSALQLRGRVMAIYTLLTLGTTVAGGPFVGWICQHWSPRTGLAVAGAATLLAAVLLALPITGRLRAPEAVSPSLAVGD